MRRLGQALVLLVMAICAAGATGFVVLAVQYHRFSADIKRSEASLPATIRAVLPPSRGTLDQPQVTLVRGSGDLASGGLVLFRTVPDQGTAAFLSVPPSATLDDVHVSRQSIRRLIHVLQARLGIQVAHVAVINLGNVSRLVDGIGGIELRNPAEVELPVSPSRTWRFPAGTLRLNGPHAAVYLRQGAPGSEQRDLAERRVLRAIVGHALEPTSVGDLQATGTAVAHSAVTDLTDADVLGLVWDRLQSQHVVQCTLPGNTPARIRYRPGRRRRVPRPRRIGSVRRMPRNGDRLDAIPAAEDGGRDRAALWSVGLRRRRGRGRPHGARHGGPLHAHAGARPGPGRPSLRPISPRIAGTAGAGMRRSEALTTRASRAGGALVEWGRSAGPRFSLPRVRPPGRDSGALVLPVGALGFRARMRRFAYTHQDALWVALVAAAVAAMLVIVFIAA